MEVMLFRTICWATKKQQIDSAGIVVEVIFIIKQANASRFVQNDRNLQLLLFQLCFFFHRARKTLLRTRSSACVQLTGSSRHSQRRTEAHRPNRTAQVAAGLHVTNEKKSESSGDKTSKLESLRGRYLEKSALSF
jgi:hypothetical protein